MTRNRNFKIRVLIGFILFIVLLTLAALAQQASTERSAKPSVVAVPSDASTSAQALIPALPLADGAGRFHVGRSQTKRQTASPIDAGTLFLPAVTYSIGEQYCFAIAVADVNGDGRPDLLVATHDNQHNGMIAVMLGNGDGTFSGPTNYSSGGRLLATSIAVADINGDGKPDIVVSNETDNTVGVLLGNGDGTFQAAVTYGSGGVEPQSVAIKDVNGDNKPDIVVANFCLGNTCSEGEVGVLLGNGDGTFQAAVIYDSGGHDASFIAVADVNGDSKPDILVANSYDGTVGVLLGNGDGTFQPAKAYSYGFTGFGYASLAVADLNGDGKPDLAVAEVVYGAYDSGSLSVLLGNGDGTFQPAVNYASGATGPDSVAVADVNGDGKPDLLVGNANGLGEGTVGVLIGNGDGTFQAPQSYDTGGIAVTVAGIAVADVNGDGKPDLLVANWLSGAVGVLLNNTAPAPSPTTITLISALGPSVYGQTVSFTAQVTSGSGTPTGTVNLLDGSIQVGSGTLTNGIVSIPVSSLPAGTNSMTAKYQGGAGFASSTSTPLSQTVSLATTTTTLTSSLNPANPHQPVTFTATVSSQFGGAVASSVVFYSGSQILGAASLTGNTASLTTSFSPTGMYYVSANYSGDGNNSGSMSSVLAEKIGSVRLPSVTTLTTSSSPSFVGQPVTFTATVTSPYGMIPSLCWVVFYDDGASIGWVTAPEGGVYTFTTSSLTAKTHTIKATFLGFRDVQPSSGTVTQVVEKYATTTTLVSTLNPSTYGQTVTFTATVTSTGPNPPTGSVKFVGIGYAPLRGAVATATQAWLNAGTHLITAEYKGDSDSAPSTSSVLDQVVNPASTTTALTSSANPSSSGQTVTFTATVTSTSGAHATGTVTFTAGTTTLGTVPLKGIIAAISTSALPVGSDTITASYAGDANFAPSTSPGLRQVVN